MNILALLVLLLPTATRAAVPAIHSWRRNLHATLASRRHLQTCEGVGTEIVGLWQDYYAESLGDAAAIQCQTVTVAGLGCRVMCTTVQYCCGDICGSLQLNFYYNMELITVSETTCVTYQENEDNELGGLTRCLEVDYCQDDGEDGEVKACSCDAKISGLGCNECSICDAEVPGTDIPFAVADCSNVGGDDLLDGECGDIEDDEDDDVWDLSLQCKNPTLPEGVDAVVVVAPSAAPTIDLVLPVRDQTEDDAPNVVGPETGTLNVTVTTTTTIQTDARPALVDDPGDASLQACNDTATYYLASAADFNPNCTCTKPQGAYNYELHCRDDCLACYDQYCHQYSFSDYFNGMGNKIAWERCDNNICEFKNEQSGYRCFSIDGQACSCSGLCDVDCSNIQENFVFNRCTIEGNFGNFTEYFTEFYRSVYMKQEDLLRGTCLSADTGIDKGLLTGLIVGGISCIVAVACFFIYIRRQGAQQKEELDLRNEETDEGEGSMERSKKGEEQEKMSSEASESDMERYSEPEAESENENNEKDKCMNESDKEQPEQLESAPEQASLTLLVPARFSRPFTFDTDSETSESEA